MQFVKCHTTRQDKTNQIDNPGDNCISDLQKQDNTSGPQNTTEQNNKAFWDVQVTTYRETPGNCRQWLPTSHG